MMNNLYKYIQKQLSFYRYFCSSMMLVEEALQAQENACERACM